MEEQIDILETKEQLLQVCEIEIKYKTKKKGTTKVKTSKDCFEIFKKVWDDDMEVRESFYAIYLNRANNVMGVQCCSKGAVSGCIVDSRIILGPAIKMLASSIVLAHNHPSGNMRASASDIQLTNKVKEAARLFEIALVDHIILDGKDTYYSLADEGML